MVIPSVCTGSTGCTASTSTAGRSTVKVVSATALPLRDEHPQVRVRNHADLWTVEDQIQRGGHVMEDPRRGGSIKHSCQATV